MCTAMRKFAADVSGATAIEYGMMALGIAIVIAVISGMSRMPVMCNLHARR